MRDVLRAPALRLLLAAYLVFKAVEWGTWIAILIYAYDADGAAAVGIVAAAQLVPAALVAPLGPALIARLSRVARGWSSLSLAYGLQAAAVAATGVAVFVAPSLVVYAFAVLMTATMTLARPVHARTLLDVAESPTALSAGNALTGAADGIGIIVGPAIAGVLYALIGPAPFLLLVGVALALTAIACRGLKQQLLPTSDVARTEKSLLTTTSVLLRTPGAAIAMLAIGATSVVGGLIDILIVVAALGPLAAGEESVGLLNAALGIGVTAAGAAAARYVGASAPLAVAVGLIVAGLALVGAGAVGSVVLFGATLTVTGLGIGIGDVASRNLLLRLVPMNTTASAFGVVEAIYTGGLAAGAALAPVLLALFLPGQAFLATGVVLLVLGVAVVPALVAAGRLLVVPAARYYLLRELPMFRPLPVPAVELLARAAEEQHVPAGSVVIREGDEGNRFFAVGGGELSVNVAGRHVTTLGAGDYFGEIALLHGTVRTATVAADTEADLLAIKCEDFLTTVLGHAVAADQLAAVVDARLAREPGIGTRLAS